MLLEAKDEIHRSRTEHEREVKERRAELSKQERRLQQKEESLDKKTDAFERKEEEMSRRLAQVAQTQQEAEEVKRQQIATLENDAALADMTIGSKSSLERIESYAIKELGMVYPDPNETYFLGESSSQAIAAGRAALTGAAATEAEAEPPAEEEAGGFFANVGSAISGLFAHSAQALEVGSD